MPPPQSALRASGARSRSRASVAFREAAAPAAAEWPQPGRVAAPPIATSEALAAAPVAQSSASSSPSILTTPPQTRHKWEVAKSATFDRLRGMTAAAAAAAPPSVAPVGSEERSSGATTLGALVSPRHLSRSVSLSLSIRGTAPHSLLMPSPPPLVPPLERFAPASLAELAVGAAAAAASNGHLVRAPADLPSPVALLRRGATAPSPVSPRLSPESSEARASVMQPFGAVEARPQPPVRDRRLSFVCAEMARHAETSEARAAAVSERLSALEALLESSGHTIQALNERVGEAAQRIRDLEDSNASLLETLRSERARASPRSSQDEAHLAYLCEQNARLIGALRDQSKANNPLDTQQLTKRCEDSLEKECERLVRVMQELVMSQ